jgi:hypothetical protein
MTVKTEQHVGKKAVDKSADEGQLGQDSWGQRGRGEV